MSATRAGILASLLQDLNRFDEQVGHLLRSNRRHIVISAEHVADSHAQIERVGERVRRQARDERSFLTRAADR